MAGEAAAAAVAFRAAIELAHASGSAYFELIALATAQQRQSPAADPARLRELLALYDGDPSPRVAEIRDRASQPS